MTDEDGAEDAGDGAEPDLSDIASEPAGDADRRLAEIAAEAVDPDPDAIDPDEPVAPEDLDVDDELVDRVAAAEPDEIAREIATRQLRVAALEEETADLRSEVDDLESRLTRKQADFQNYKKRQQDRLEEEKRRATEDLVTRLLDVRDNLQRALDQDEGADIRDGVASTLRQFDQQLERENVERIDPEPGAAPDPTRHEVLMRVESERPADTIDAVHRSGYEMAGKVLRPAQVTVSEGPAEEATGEAAEGSGDADA